MCHIRNTIRALFESSALAPAYSCKFSGNYEKCCSSRISLRILGFARRTGHAEKYVAIRADYERVFGMVLKIALSTQHAFGQTVVGCSFHKPSQPALQQEPSPYGSTERPAGTTHAQHRPCDRILGDLRVSSLWRHVALCWRHTARRRPCDRILGEQWG